MYKILFAVGIVLSMNACSQVKITAAMCGQIESDPRAQVPQECRAYSEEEAKKAFDKVRDEKKVEDKDIIEFHKEK